MNKSTLNLAAIALFFTITFTACKKDSNSPDKNDENLESAESNSMAESYYNDVTTLVDAANTFGQNMTFRTTESLLTNCVTVTINTTVSPKTITIDFGSSNCQCIDGRNRRGKILASYTGNYTDQGTVINITFDNYFVNDNQVKGTKTITNMGLNNNSHLVYQIAVNGQVVKANNKGTITWISTREREWIAGANTPLNLLDDTYGITGSANGTTASGHPYNITITQQLIRKISCNWIESGVITLVPEGLDPITLNYGNGTCDANAVVTYNNKNYDILLQ